MLVDSLVSIPHHINGVRPFAQTLRNKPRYQSIIFYQQNSHKRLKLPCQHSAINMGAWVIERNDLRKQFGSH